MLRPDTAPAASVLCVDCEFLMFSRFRRRGMGAQFWDSKGCLREPFVDGYGPLSVTLTWRPLLRNQNRCKTVEEARVCICSEMIPTRMQRSP